MNFDEIQNTWNSPRNIPPTEQQQKLAEQFTRQMKRRRRFQAAWLVNTFVALTIITGIAVRVVARGRVDSAQEWALFPLLAVPWTFAIVFLRRFLKPGDATQQGELPITDSLRNALAANRSSQTHLRLVGVLYAVFIPVLALTLRQMHAVGKVSAHELVSMIGFFGVALAISGVVVAVRYFAGLRPQEKRLTGLLAELTNEAA
ncbi:MAG TPA: hypothetical protein VK327_09270 [Candidatus Paceibacterota bacterium]|nr:hypothetical protein [Candidatus Paceibacterota bacterium]